MAALSPELLLGITYDCEGRRWLLAAYENRLGCGLSPSVISRSSENELHSLVSEHFPEARRLTQVSLENLTACYQILHNAN